MCMPNCRTSLKVFGRTGGHRVVQTRRECAPTTYNQILDYIYVTLSLSTHEVVLVSPVLVHFRDRPSRPRRFVVEIHVAVKALYRPF
jgi:hypothetical protein